MQFRMVPDGGDKAVVEFKAKVTDDLTKVAQAIAEDQKITIPPGTYRFERVKPVPTWIPIGGSVQMGGAK